MQELLTLCVDLLELPTCNLDLQELSTCCIDLQELLTQRAVYILYLTIERLHKTQDLLYESTQSMLKLRNQWNDKSNMWLSEKDKLVMELDKCRGRLNVNRQDYPDVSPQRNVSNNNILTVDSTAKYRLESKVIFFFLHVTFYHWFIILHLCRIICGHRIGWAVSYDKILCVLSSHHMRACF